MKFIDRIISSSLKESFSKFPSITVTGPRQAGKSTLLRKLFPELPYINFESINIRALAQEDPEGFMEQYRGGAILDEAQRVPELFSVLQVIMDEQKKSGQFVISGSQNFLLLEGISQTLAGRTSIFHLLPFTMEELGNLAPQTLNERMFKGGYPPIYDRNLQPDEWLDGYVQTFIERDIRSIKNIANLDQFRLFVKMCAARSGQILELTSLGNDCGISSNTAKAWLSLLETSFIVHRLQPYYRNFNKRLIKAPKLFFWDSGLLCFLLGIKAPEDLAIHANRGAIFETYIVSELKKFINNHRTRDTLYYWKDKAHELDGMLESSPGIFKLLEIKSGKTYASDYREAIDYVKQVTGHNGKNAIIYAGDQEQNLTGNIALISEKNLTSIFRN